MKTRGAILFVIVGLGLACGLVLVYCLRNFNKPLVRLKVVRQSVEAGKSIMIFQVEGAEGRRLSIFNVLKIEGEETEGTLVEKAHGVFVATPDFWAPNQRSPIGIPEEGRKEFGVVVPTSAVWKLRVTVDVEDPNSLRRFTDMWSLARDVGRGSLSTLRDLAGSIWHRSYTHPEFIESQSITNAVAFAGEVTK